MKNACRPDWQTEFADQIDDLLHTPAVQNLQYYPHHHRVTRYEHVLLVAQLSFRIARAWGLDSRAVARSALLHDLCKIGCYKAGSRNVKGSDGKWTAVPTFYYEDTLPYGHGEKSVYIISGFLKLTREEAMAIRWHMGFSGTDDSRLVGKAFAKYPLAFALSTADCEATYFLEGTPS